MRRAAITHTHTHTRTHIHTHIHIHTHTHSPISMSRCCRAALASCFHPSILSKADANVHASLSLRKAIQNKAHPPALTITHAHAHGTLNLNRLHKKHTTHTLIPSQAYTHAFRAPLHILASHLQYLLSAIHLSRDAFSCRRRKKNLKKIKQNKIK